MMILAQKLNERNISLLYIHITVILVIEAMHILPFEILDLSPVTHLLREMCYIIGFSLSTAETFANVSSNFIGGNLMEKIGKILST